MPESKRPWVHNVRFAYRWRVVGTVPRGRQVSLIDPTLPRKARRCPHDRLKKR